MKTHKAANSFSLLLLLPVLPPPTLVVAVVAKGQKRVTAADKPFFNFNFLSFSDRRAKPSSRAGLGDLQKMIPSTEISTIILFV